MAAHAVNNEIRTEYHIFQHIPNEVRDALARLGLNVKKPEETNLLRILDTYSITSGLAPQEKQGKSRVLSMYEAQTFNLSDWSIGMARVIKEGVGDDEKRWLHIDDNTSILNQYSDEKSIIDIWRTRAIPYAGARELVMFHSHVNGVVSDAFHKQFEQLCDGIIDFKSEEKEGQMQHLVRIRSLRGQNYNSRWHQLRMLDDGEVTLVD